MNNCDTVDIAAAPERAEKLIRLPLGLLGFEAFKQYLLLSDPADAPFHWLQVQNDPGLSFLVLSPFEVVPDYELNLSDDDVGFLKISSPSDVLIYNIVTMHPGGRATINLKGPIVINRLTAIGKQVVLSDGLGYSLRHPLPTAE